MSPSVKVQDYDKRCAWEMGSRGEEMRLKSLFAAQGIAETNSVGLGNIYDHGDFQRT